ncbi:MAG: ATP-binding cassette domain-containing protein [Bdellovibrio sp.]|nr:ATP-binding cassette domain-containing protein [Bdellovibrio sp.]
MGALKGSFSLSYPGFALAIEFSISSAAVTVVMGPSGSGKSTFLRCLAGLQVPQGELFFGEEMWQGRQYFKPTHERNLGYVFQDGNLFPHLCVEDNLRMGLKKLTPPRFEWDHVVQVFGLKKILKRTPMSLSGGEKQRVAMARALLSGPDLLLMDEPLSALDTSSKNDLMPFLESMKSEFGVPTVYVTHSILEASRVGDYLLLMDQGRCKEFGSAHELWASDQVLRGGISNLVDLQKRFGLNL